MAPGGKLLYSHFIVWEDEDLRDWMNYSKTCLASVCQSTNSGSCSLEAWVINHGDFPELGD